MLDRFEILDCKTLLISINLEFSNVTISSNEFYKANTNTIY